MRDIKFRGRKFSNGEWIYGSLMISKFKDNKREKYYISQFLGNYTYNHEVDSKTVGQMTGLKDKNGKEIYEGDIVQFKNHKGTIEYYTGNVGGGEFRITPNGDRHFYDEMGVKFSWNEIEIIGNLYENKELL